MSEFLQSAQDCLHILQVNLKECKVYVNPDVEISDVDRESLLVQSFRGVLNVKVKTLETTDNKTGHEYLYRYSAGLRLIPREDENDNKIESEDYKPVLEITALFESTYLSDRLLEDDERNSFANLNVGYHVWPYWREYVQSTCARVGYAPPIEIPMYLTRNGGNDTNLEG